MNKYKAYYNTFIFHYFSSPINYPIFIIINYVFNSYVQSHIITHRHKRYTSLFQIGFLSFMKNHSRVIESNDI